MRKSQPATVRSGETETVRISLDPKAGSIARMLVVHFASNKSFVEPCMRRVLQQAAQFAKDNPDDKLVLLGHTDKVDTDEYNQSLSERRARSVFAFLTFGRDPDASLTEWKELRQKRPKGEIRTVKDSWGLREAQHMLQDLGFYPGNVDGKPGPLTNSAIRAFRCKAGLPPGEELDDKTFDALMKAYMAQDSFDIAVARFLPNCSKDDVLKWLGAGEQDPVKNVPTAFRPNRRTELLFVKIEKIPCKVPPPDTMELVPKGAGYGKWCLGTKEEAKTRTCFLLPHLPKDGKPGKDQLTREPVDNAILDVSGSILREARAKNGMTEINADGTVKLEPVPGGQKFVLIAPDGEISAGENPGNGEGVPAVTKADGSFKVSGKKSGFYCLEVIGPVLARIKEEGDGTVRGNAVCKRLTAATDRLDVVLVNAPVLREIRLPVAVHLITALKSDTRALRPCTPPGGGLRFAQRSAQTAESIRKLFEGDGNTVRGANFVWRQARIRFDPVDVIEGAFANPSRPECMINNAEMGAFLNLCAYPNTVNVFFVGGLDDTVGRGEAGAAVSPESAPSEGVREPGCLVGDRFVTTFDGRLLSQELNVPKQIQVLAHELGHFLNLKHLESPDLDLPANSDRLMAPGTTFGQNLRLVQTEVDTARASKGARLACTPLTLEVTGAFRIGGPRSHEHIFVRPGPPAATPPVTVDAKISDDLIQPGVGTVKMEGGEAGANDRQRRVSTGAKGLTEVTATYTPASGDPVTARVNVRVVDFTLRVEGETVRPRSPGSTTFLVVRDPVESVVVVAVIDPQPFCVPKNMVQWTNGDEKPDPLRREVSIDKVGHTRVTAKLGDAERFVDILVIETALVTNQVPFDNEIRRVTIEGVLNSDRTSFDVSNLFDTQPDSLFRIRADVPTVPGETPAASFQSNLVSLSPAGAVIENRAVVLNRTTGDRFVSQPVLAIPETIPRTDLQFKSPQSLEVLRSRAEGKTRLTVDGLAGLGTVEVTTQGFVVELCTVTIKGTSPKPERDLETANRVWAQFGIEVRVLGSGDPVDRPDLLDIENPTRGADPEVVALYALGRDTCSADVIGYYIKSLRPGALGRRVVVPLRDGFMVTDKGTRYTFGHELGHVLGLDHVQGDRNLMFEEGTAALPDEPRDVLLVRDQFSNVKFNAHTVLKP